MTKRLAFTLLAGIVLLAGSLACSFVPQRIAQRFAAEPTPTLEPTKTPRPTFTPTPDWTPTPTVTLTPTDTPIPPDTPTPLPTDTPTIPPPTDTPTPAPPTNTPPPPPPRPTDTPAPPPPPTYPFSVAEQGNREFTHTNNHTVVIYVEILNAAGTPLGGYRVVGDSSDGQHVVSPESCWDWCKASPAGGYAKVANIAFEPGSFFDGSWTIYMVDGGGTQVSPAVTFNYSSDPGQWVWDFVLFRGQ